MWRESSSRLALHQPGGCCVAGNKARAEARERAGHRCGCQCSRSIIWNLTAAKLTLRVAKLVGFFQRRWQKVAKGTSNGNSPAAGLKQSQASIVIVLFFWKKRHCQQNPNSDIPSCCIRAFWRAWDCKKKIQAFPHLFLSPSQSNSKIKNRYFPFPKSCNPWSRMVFKLPARPQLLGSWQLARWVTPFNGVHLLLLSIR